MHELALVEGIMDTVRLSADTNGITRVGKIKLVIGKLSMALPESLDFAFDCLKQQDTLFNEARLEIEEKDVIGKCRICNREFIVNEGYYQCDQCEASSIDLISGRELYIDFFEGDTD